MLYKECLENGIWLEGFWDMTVGEIADYSKAFLAREKAKAIMYHRLGYLIGHAFHKPSAYPALNDIFPNLFEEEKPQKQDWRIMKDRIMQYGKMKRLAK